MDNEDIYYYFLVEAILNNDPNLLYLYDKNGDILFRIKKINNLWMPAFYNENLRTELYLRRTKQINKFIKEFMQKSSSICELKRIDEFQKKIFINQYISSIPDEDKREELKRKLEYSNLRGNERIVGKILGDTFLGIDYSHKLWLFLENTLKVSYYSLGISLKSHVYL